MFFHSNTAESAIFLSVDYLGLEEFLVADNRHIDQEQVRDHIESVLQDCEQVFEKFFLAKFIGLNFEYLPQNVKDSDKSVSKITFDVNEMLMNPQGALHGGVMAAVMDISMGHLLNKTAGKGATIEMKIQYLRPVISGKVTCEGRFIKKGRILSFMESRLSDQAGKLAAVATATWKMPE
jgi:uncharacterized protein (TIGR00369 family)